MTDEKSTPLLWLLAAFALIGAHMLVCPLYVAPLVESGYGSIDMAATNSAINFAHGLALGVVGIVILCCALMRVFGRAWPWEETRD